MKKNKLKKQRGFVILIAIVVSSLLVSLGMFISNIAYKELTLSTSAKASQEAFFIADSVIECALRHDFDPQGGFVVNAQDYTNKGGKRTSAAVKLACNNKLFTPDSISTNSQQNFGLGNRGSFSIMNSISANSNRMIVGGNAKSIYYISFAKDTDGDSVISTSEAAAYNAPYAKLEVIKEDIGGPNDKTILRAYGHNKYLGKGIVERALEVTY